MSQPYSIPASAMCPGCQTVVVLPALSLDEDAPPAICATCGADVPDYRRVSQATVAQSDVVRPTPREEPPIEDQRYSRRNLFRSLGGLVAEKGIVKIDEVKSRFTDI